MKFANYFLSRKHTHLLKDVFALLQVLNTLVSSKVCGIAVNVMSWWFAAAKLRSHMGVGLLCMLYTQHLSTCARAVTILSNLLYFSE